MSDILDEFEAALSKQIEDLSNKNSIWNENYSSDEWNRKAAINNARLDIRMGIKDIKRGIKRLIEVLCGVIREEL